MFLFPAEALSSASWSGSQPAMLAACRRRARRGQARSRLPPARPRRLRRRAEHFDRLCRDGAHAARRDGAGRDGLERCRHLGRAVAGRRQGRRRQRRWSATSWPRTRAIAICAPNRAWSRRSGVEDLVVVATADAVLVADRDRAQDVKRLVARLERDGRGELTTHPLVHRPWGTYRSIHIGDRVQVKHIIGEARRQIVAADASPSRRALGGGARTPPRWCAARTSLTAAREQIDLHPPGHAAPAGESRQDPLASHRSAIRQLSRRGRHRALRG